MKSLYLLPFLSTIVFVTQRHSIEGTGDLWPYPQSVHFEETFYTIDSKAFNWTLKTKGKCDLLEKAISRYENVIFVEDCSLVSDRGIHNLFETKREFNEINYKGDLREMMVWVDGECETVPHMYMDEMYTIDVKDNNSMIYSKSVWGAIRGLETFSQMVQNVGLNQFIANTSHIVDFPRFSHRGVMLDTSRHYIPVKELEHNLDSMAYNKFNVFHWHLVDDQSFPFVSLTFPNLSLKGAFNPKTHIYSVEDVKHIIEYATERGIRVLTEFDTPGHTLAWGNGQPDLLTECYAGDKPDGTFGPIDPIKDSSYDFITKLFTEVINRFPDQYLHLGGDEVDFSCWRSNPDIRAFMKARNITDDFPKLEQFYIQKVLDIVKTLNRSYIVWQEVFDNGVVIKPDTLVHVWKGDNWKNEMLSVTKSGYQALLSACWYLNYISYGTDWPNYYACDPQEFNGTETENKLVIGGEACMWAEWVDGSNLMSRTWPRAIAVAERLWSDKGMNDFKAAKGRFNRQHCLMQQRGMHVAPASGPGFCQCDYAI